MYSQTATFQRTYVNPHAAPMRFGATRRLVEPLPTFADVGAHLPTPPGDGAPARRVGGWERRMAGGSGGAGRGRRPARAAAGGGRARGVRGERAAGGRAGPRGGGRGGGGGGRPPGPAPRGRGGAGGRCTPPEAARVRWFWR